MYDIGTEIIIFHCFATNMLKSFCKSRFLAGSKALAEILRSTVSKQDFKHFSKIDNLGFTAIVFHLVLKHMNYNI